MTRDPQGKLDGFIVEIWEFGSRIGAPVTIKQARDYTSDETHIEIGHDGSYSIWNEILDCHHGPNMTFEPNGNIQSMYH